MTIKGNLEDYKSREVLLYYTKYTKLYSNLSVYIYIYLLFHSFFVSPNNSLNEVNAVINNDNRRTQ